MGPGIHGTTHGVIVCGVVCASDAPDIHTRTVMLGQFVVVTASITAVRGIPVPVI
jgi:hypothetical protein